MESAQRAAQLVSVAILATAICASAEIRKEFRFTVGPGAAVSITNQYGPISVKPGAGNQVVVNAVLHSDRAEIDQSQSGNRVDIISHLFFEATPDTGRVDYEVSVPADASVTLRSTTGPLRAEGLHGDVTLEGSQSNMDVRDISDAHVHIKTLNGFGDSEQYPQRACGSHLGQRRRGAAFRERPAGAGQLDQRQDPL